MPTPNVMTIDDLYRRFDGRVPSDLIRLALRAPKRIAHAAQTRLTVRYHDSVVIAEMVEAIVEIHEASGGTVTEQDLRLRGFTQQQVDHHRGAAMRNARPRLREIAA